jgi:hypothetical protein
MPSATWTYSERPWSFTTSGQFTDLTSIADTIRFLIADTDASDQQLFDTEIQGVMAQNGVTLLSCTQANTGRVYLAAIECARAVIGKYTRQVNKTSGDLSIQAASRATQYRDLIRDLTTQAQRHLVAVPYVGGISAADKTLDEQNSDIVQPSFAKGFMDDPGTAPDAGISNANPFDGFNRLTPG